jgi:hypothetical protein
METRYILTHRGQKQYFGPEKGSFLVIVILTRTVPRLFVLPMGLSDLLLCNMPVHITQLILRRTNFKSEDRSSMFLRNVGNRPPYCMVSEPRTP